MNLYIYCFFSIYFRFSFQNSISIYTGSNFFPDNPHIYSRSLFFLFSIRNISLHKKLSMYSLSQFVSCFYDLQFYWRKQRGTPEDGMKNIQKDCHGYGLCFLCWNRLGIDTHVYRLLSMYANLLASSMYQYMLVHFAHVWNINARVGEWHFGSPKRVLPCE